MSNFVAAALEAAKTNDLPSLRTAITAWQAQETPRRASQPMLVFQEALEEALKNHNVEAAEELINRGCEISRDVVIAAADSFDEPDWDSRSFDVLIEAGFDVDEDLGLVGTALSMAILAERPRQVEYLLENGADPNGNHYMDMSPVQWASTRSQEMVDILLAHGARDDRDEMSDDDDDDDDDDNDYEGTDDEVATDGEDATNGHITTNGLGRE
ncbi:hypothetical protein ASPWEDRAFT_43970 [Aspergillus wentii DTO 134E9]|uniref:Uncharacterized protein n=1 Tax=Aspergillus wentii DTO 134E9 TaxID=1073089 RepID=A0A1L9RAR0_ASPWE|nr:uncharacterized protein ASPWEDRAFT_43970 [Aspergillus wentii DTO 134E9]KAI9934548.1 hypothetical protein MW887_000163 [Aspergillus wentii]OJJ31963.1 hypothetical protein ASPWEDRAFT_43970 [Aspergillus wentii DTO 134E9]